MVRKVECRLVAKCLDSHLVVGAHCQLCGAPHSKKVLLPCYGDLLCPRQILFLPLLRHAKIVQLRHVANE
jgi:hypothetical protein